MSRPERRPLVVLESFADPLPTTNPYIVMLLRALRSTDGLTALTFSWRRALTARYDVFHAHWPELLVTNGSGPKRLARQLLFLALMLRFSIQKIPVVQTQHNLHPHTSVGRLPRALLRMLDRRTPLLISINQLPPHDPRPVRHILHGDYREWYGPHRLPDPEQGQLAFFGLIRPYKGVDSLLRAFAGTGPHLRLAVRGKPDDAGLTQELHDAAARDPRISLGLHYLSDEELVDHVGRSILVVLPYKQGLNSGGALAALSLSRPVLMPATEPNRVLADEVGADWVRLYEGELTAALLETEAERALALTGRPNLAARRWELAGAEHLAAFREALALSRSL